jgi:hypothetical protein
MEHSPNAKQLMTHHVGTSNFALEKLINRPCMQQPPREMEDVKQINMTKNIRTGESIACVR